MNEFDPNSSPKELDPSISPLPTEAGNSNPSPPHPVGFSSSYEDPWLHGESTTEHGVSSTIRVLIVSVAVLALIVVSVFLFMVDSNDVLYPGSFAPNTSNGPFSFSTDTRRKPDAEDYGSYQEFFDDYYELADGSASTNSIPRAETGTGVTLALTDATGRELSLQEIYRKCNPAIVSISAYVTPDSATGYYWGSGIVMTEDGYIVTNAHIIEGTASVAVALSDGTKYEALLVGDDAQSDLAVLKIDAANLICAEFGNSDLLQAGDEVVAIGNPLGEMLRGTMTNGIISAINRDIEYNGHLMTLLQTNAALNDGNSGGALINKYGQVIGITNMKSVSSYFSIEGLGFAIPTQNIKPVVDSLIDCGIVKDRPAIGIVVGKAIPASAKAYFDLPDGAYVAKVHPNSDAFDKGLRPGDIIVAVNGEPIRSSDKIFDAKNALSVGDGITFSVFRDGQTFDVYVILCESANVAS